MAYIIDFVETDGNEVGGAILETFKIKDEDVFFKIMDDFDEIIRVYKQYGEVGR